MYKYREKIAEPSPPSSKKQKRPDFRDCSDFRPVTNVSPHILSPFHPVPPPLHSQTVARTRTRKGDDRLQQKQQTRRSAVFTDISRVPHGVLCVCRDALEFLHHREHKDRREETEDDEYRPDGPQRNSAPKEPADGYEQIADGRSTEPATHHHPLILGRRHFRDERNTHR